MAKRSKARTAGENARWAEGRIAPSMAELERRFGTEEQCERYLISLKYPGGFVCERCGHGGYKKVGNRREYRCTGCNRQFSATVGTVLEGTKLPLTKWFRAAWMVSADTRGASAQAVARECGVSDLTAHAMLRRLRTPMGLSMALCRVGGDWVEVDCAHVSCGNGDGTGVGRPGPGRSDAPVLVAASASRCVLRACSDANGSSMAEFAGAHVSRRHEVRCDEHGANQALLGGWDARPRKSARDGDSEASLPVVHHVISNFKAWIAGTFHGVTVARLQEYCDEFSWRYCHRAGDAFADLLAELCRWPHVALSGIRSCRVAMPAHEPPSEPGRRHNQKILARWQARQREERRGHVARMAGILSAGARLVPERDEADDLSERLLSMLDSAFEVVPTMAEDANPAA